MFIVRLQDGLPDVGFFRGLAAPFRGAAFISHHRLWGYLVVPALLNGALAVAVAILGARIVRDRLPADWFVTSPFAAKVAFLVLGGLVALVLFVLIQPVVGAPFVDALTEKVETLARGSAPKVGVMLAAWHAIGHGLAKTFLYGLSVGVAFVLSAVTGVGGAIGLALYALSLAYDGFDYPLARRKVSFGGKWRYLVLHPGQTLGYCLGASVIYLVPVAILVAPSFAAVGATLAFLETTPASIPEAGLVPQPQDTKGPPA